MQTVKISTELLAATIDFCEHNNNGENPAHALYKVLDSTPTFSNTLAPLYELANRAGQPIAGIDIESTGRNPTKDRIVELAVIIIYPYESEAAITTHRWLLNPGRPIPAEATAVHGYSNADVEHAPNFSTVANEVTQLLAGCIIVGFNSNSFDVPLLMAEIARAGYQWPAPGTLLIDPRVIFVKNEGRGLADAVKFYCYQNSETAHQAEADTYQALAVLAAQLEMYPELAAMDAEQLDAYCQRGERVDFSGKLSRNKDGQVVFAFGQHKDKPVKEQRGYASWMLSGDFSEDTKAAIRAELK